MNEYLHCSLMDNTYKKAQIHKNVMVWHIALNIKSEHYAIIKILIMEEGMGSWY